MSATTVAATVVTTVATTSRPGVARRPEVAGLGPSDAVAAWRRRAAVLTLLLALTFLLTVAIGRVTAGADLADPVAGHVVLQPGETLWDVAAASAPAGGDTRDQLARIVELNGFTTDRLQAWTVVLLPAR